MAVRTTLSNEERTSRPGAIQSEVSRVTPSLYVREGLSVFGRADPAPPAQNGNLRGNISQRITVGSLRKPLSKLITDRAKCLGNLELLRSSVNPAVSDRGRPRRLWRGYGSLTKGALEMLGIIGLHHRYCFC